MCASAARTRPDLRVARGHDGRLLALAAIASLSLARVAAAAPGDHLGADAAGRFVALALACVHKEYPNKISHVLNGDEDVRAPHDLTPAFYGCYDWHSAVHAHWLLVRAARLYPAAPFAAAAREAVGRSVTPRNISGELHYMQRDGMASFERPYGLAWLLQLGAELRSWSDPDAARWAETLAPLETEALARLQRWLPKLRYAIRIGEHAQTAFAFGLVWDWAAIAQREDVRQLLRTAADRFYRRDRGCPLAYEPSGEDFLSPCLAEADFMRRVLPQPEFSRWLAAFLPQIPRAGSADTRRSAEWLVPGVVTDRQDPKLAHIDGLNLSRAWMLEGIAASLPMRDARAAALRATARAHRDAALPAVTGEHYEGGHWLGTFAMYLASRAQGVAMP
jgi:hypothetical protein